MASRTNPKENRMNPNSLANLKKGGSPGRKAIPPDVKAMFTEATPGAVQLLIDTANNVDADLKLRIDCADKILDRALGKARQSLEADIKSEVTTVLVSLEDKMKVIESIKME